MREFTDTLGRKWSISFDAAGEARVRSFLGIPKGDLDFTEPSTLLPGVWAIVSEQAAVAGVDQGSFYAGLDKAVLDAVTDVMVAEFDQSQRAETKATTNERKITTVRRRRIDLLLRDALKHAGKVPGYKIPVYGRGGQLDHYAKQMFAVKAKDLAVVCKGNENPQAKRLLKTAVAVRPETNVFLPADDLFTVLDSVQRKQRRAKWQYSQAQG